ncbi:MAG: endonuclease [Chloroflexi bacterium]|nr:endonuclease [Chloroflexota bacterium]
MNSPSPSVILGIYQRLYGAYGPQRWWPGAEDSWEVIVGAILTQNTAWANVDRALARLKAAQALAPSRIRELPQEELAQLIRSSGYFNTKARKLKAFAQHLGQRYGDDLAALLRQDPVALRRELLSIYGIGQETADDILLYAAGTPSFVIDAYTRRILGRLGIAPKGDAYDAFQAVFHANLPPDASLFNEYHALLDRHAKVACRKLPLCQGCPLLDLCPTGQGLQRGG